MNPTLAKFFHLDDGEHVIFDVRKHWFIIFMEILWTIIGIIAPPIILYIVYQYDPAIISFIVDDARMFIFFYSAWCLICWITCFAIITDYILDVVRVTNKRIIDIDQQGFFSRNIATMRLEDLQDITIESSGIIATLLKFGSLKLQSAGEQREFLIRGVRHPEVVRMKIIDHHDKVESAPKKVEVV